MSHAAEISAIAVNSGVTGIWPEQSARNKKNAVQEDQGKALKKGDSVALSAAAREKYAAVKGKKADATGAVGDEDTVAEGVENVAAKSNNGQAANVRALKEAIMQMAEESGQARGGWALGQYKKAFASGDTEAMRGIFAARHPGAAFPVPGGDPATGLDPEPGTDTEPGTGLDTDPAADPGTGLDTEPAVTTEPGVDTEPAVDTEPTIDTGTEKDPTEELMETVEKRNEEAEQQA